jgi:hypothetical protein
MDREEEGHRSRAIFFSRDRCRGRRIFSPSSRVSSSNSSSSAATASSLSNIPSSPSLPISIPSFSLSSSNSNRTIIITPFLPQPNALPRPTPNATPPPSPLKAVLTAVSTPSTSRTLLSLPHPIFTTTTACLRPEAIHPQRRHPISQAGFSIRSRLRPASNSSPIRSRTRGRRARGSRSGASRHTMSWGGCRSVVDSTIMPSQRIQGCWRFVTTCVPSLPSLLLYLSFFPSIHRVFSPLTTQPSAFSPSLVPS